MARQTNNSQLWSALSLVGVGRNKASSPASSTVNADTAAGSATIVFAGASTFAANQIVRVGQGSDAEIVEIASMASATATLKWVTQKAHLAGEDCKEQTKTNLGPTTDDGVDMDLEADMQALFGGTRRLFFGMNFGHFRPIMKFGLKNFNQENLAFSLGMKESEVAGASTAADPRRLFVDGTKLGLDVDAWLYFTGVLHDTLTNVELQIWGAEIDWSKALKARYKLGGDDFVIPCEASPTSGLFIKSWQ